ncbi:MAG: hypothetical protein ACKOEE_12655 [Tagaea sp.]
MNNQLHSESNLKFDRILGAGVRLSLKVMDGQYQKGRFAKKFHCSLTIGLLNRPGIAGGCLA